MSFKSSFFERLGHDHAKQVWANRPSWLAKNRDHNSMEHAFLAGVLMHHKCEILCEIGVSSGFTSAVLLSAARQYCDQPLLYGIDFAEKVYSNRSKNVGSALLESFNEYRPYFDLHTSSTSLNMPEIIKEKLDFVFIDGNHYHPWPTLDLINVLPFMKNESLVCLHDVRLPRGWQQGGVYLYECFDAQKVLGHDKEKDVSTNVGLIQLDADIEKTVDSIIKTIGLQWQTIPDQETFIQLFDNIRTHYPVGIGSKLIESLDSAQNYYDQYKTIIEEASVRQRKHYWQLSADRQSLATKLHQFSNMGPLRAAKFFVRRFLS